LQVHGWLATITMGILFPAMAVIARNFKEFNPSWFYLHRGLGVFSFLGAVAAIGIGLHLGTTDQMETVHEAIGCTVLCTSFLQVLAIVLRPAKVGDAFRRSSGAACSLGCWMAWAGAAGKCLGFRVCRDLQVTVVGTCRKYVDMQTTDVT
jgi:hypothetical protein